MNINYSSTIFLSKKALADNLSFIRSFMNEKTSLSAVIKGNAYGHGARKMLPVLQELGVDHFSVFSSYEAKQVADLLNPQSSLMIMGDIPDQDASWIVENEFEFFVINLSTLTYFLKEAKKQKKKISIHLEIETGMNRHGLEKADWQTLITILNKNKEHINLKGICTHFAGAEDSANHDRIIGQQKIFREFVDVCSDWGWKAERLHTSCSAAMLAFPEWNLDMVRIGILLYGLWPGRESELVYKMGNQSGLNLKPVLSWVSSVMEIKQVKTGEFIGYGDSYLAEREMKIASIPVGYGYGFSRRLSNTGRVLLNGRRLSVVGMVNMNMFLIDVTDVEAKIGDKVTLIGQDGDQEIKVSYFGNLASQLNYELLTRLDKSIPRIIADSDSPYQNQ